MMMRGSVPEAGALWVERIKAEVAMQLELAAAQIRAEREYEQRRSEICGEIEDGA
jgi:hypothetical protein